MDVELLSRIQFAGTIAFHYLFPPLSIGLGLLLVMMEGAYMWTKDHKYLVLTRFWTTIFGLIFGIGVASGIVMEFQFGTNWATYSRFVGDVFGSTLAAEGIFAFFLESGFLAVVLFGWDRVPKWFHFFSTCMVCLGAHFSAIWIVVANSWQQTPAGFHVVGEGIDRRAEITDFWAMVFNPSSVDRLIHVTLGAYLAASFLVLSVSAFYLLKGRHRGPAMASIRFALVLATFAATCQLLSGHRSAIIVSEHQPAKLAAFEGLYETQSNAPSYIFGWVDNENETVNGIAIPGLLSYFVGFTADTEVTGLDAFAPEDRPPVQASFQFFHIMVTIGFLLIGISWLGIVLWGTGILFKAQGWLSRGYLWILVFAVLLPQIANQAGWFAAEVGRQPWIVYNLLRTVDGHSKVVTAGQVWFSIGLFGFIYGLLFILFVFLLDQKIRKGPVEDVATEGGAKRILTDTNPPEQE
jgi:cytochrome d ubiquinol oxidase subunit I